MSEMQGKRYPLNMRTTKDVREKLESVARANGRSMAQEVEFRLERSFERDERLPDEAMRMQALEIGAAMCRKILIASDGSPDATPVKAWAAWAYREATGREW